MLSEIDEDFNQARPVGFHWTYNKNTKDLTPVFGGQFIPANYGQAC